jgi:hypothetical protein
MVVTRASVLPPGRQGRHESEYFYSDRLVEKTGG